jgi:hypothetical protein
MHIPGIVNTYPGTVWEIEDDAKKPEPHHPELSTRPPISK